MASKIATKLANLDKKAAKLEVVELEKPVVSTDLVKQFKSASGGTTDTANEYVVDVFPNFIPIICFLMMLANRAATAADYKTHAKASPPTIILYYVTILYSYFLACDVLIRPTASIHGRIWQTESLRTSLLDFLLTLPVPEEMEFILAQFAPSNTERSPNVFFIPSAQGFDHHRYFGRFFPIKLFADIHNTVASVPGTSTPGKIYHNLFRRAVALRAGTYSMNLGDLLGINVSGGNLESPPSRFFQIFQNVFNPVLFRDFHRRSSLALIPLEVPEFDNLRYNAWDAIFGFTSSNAQELEVVLRSLSSILKNTVTMKRSLLDVLRSSSGMNILHHGYTLYQLPTWSYNTKVDYSSITKDSDLDSVTNKTFAHSIGYLQPSAVPKDATDVPDIIILDNKDHDATETHHVKEGQFPLVTSTQRTVPSKDIFPNHEDDLELFDPKEHVSPRVRVLDIHGSGTVDAYLATMTGKIIESFELDGQTVPMPNLDMALGLENSHFADSAFPYPLAIKATDFDHGTTTPLPPPVKRVVERDELRFAASHLLRDRTQIVSPLVVHPIRDPAFPTLGYSYPGFIGQITDWLRAAQSFIGLRTIAPDAPLSSTDKLRGSQKKSFYVWSPYTFTSRQDPKPTRSDSQFSRTYFLMNLRTLFGTDYNLVEINNVYHALPSS